MKTFDTFNAIIAIGLITGSANAADFSFTGNFPDNNQVQEFNFAVVGAADDVTLRTWSYAGGTNAEGATIASGGFDPIVSLFNASTGALIAYNDDGGSQVSADSVTGAHYDSFLMQNLSAGNYIATVTQFSSFAHGSLADGFAGTGHTDFNGRDSHWALDVLNVQSASLGTSYVSATFPSPVPEPESYALLLAGLALVGFMARHKQVSRRA